ncbi:MAG: hypothetical protein WBQ60_13235 [Asticcacaulis sp.]
MKLIILATFCAFTLANGVFAHTSQNDNNTMDLVCYGEGSYKDQNVVAGTSTSNGQVATTTSTIYTSKNYTGQVYFHMDNEGGRLKLPSAITPKPANPFEKKPEWSLIKDLVVTQNDISGRVPYALMRGGGSMAMRIDRITGNIIIDGSAFTGRCEPYDPMTVKRKF